METLSKAAVKIWRIGNNQFRVDRLQIIVVAKNIILLQLFMHKMRTIPQSASAPLNPTVLQLFISRMPKMCAIPQLVSAPLNPTVLQLFISRMPKMCAIPQLVSAPLNPTVLQLFISRMPKMCAIPQLVSAPF